MEKTIPEYALQPINSFHDYWIESSRLLSISISGMETLTGIPQLMESLGFSGKGIQTKKSPETVEQQR